MTVDGPAGSGEFGRAVTMLPNGNFVVTDPGFDAPGPIADVGAVYLYRPNGTLISTLRGGSFNDRVGSAGIVVLANGNFVIRSPEWRNGEAGRAGAVTFASGTSGSEGIVSPSNSLVGGTAGDTVGDLGVTALTNGNYVVISPNWDNGGIWDAGAVTFGSGISGIAGVVSSTNSLVGSQLGDFVGGYGVTALANGNYVVRSPSWDNGPFGNSGAVTFGSGTSGINGVVSPANSLVGSVSGDEIGSLGVTALTNGNYVVVSPGWNNGGDFDVGAVTFGSGTSGIAGVVSPANSLVGSTEGDSVGFPGVTALTNGNYVVCSLNWDDDEIANAGAVTFGSGTNGITGVVSAANSLIGSKQNDYVGGARATALTNGNYVVLSPFWDDGVSSNVGAVTLGSGTSGTSGVVSVSNSLVGLNPNDDLDVSVTALTNGN
ncbi:MAG: hypothetical protein KDI56_10240, partial [Xanthomonadales bacterium]|nr:hypothetical protein [Xanthomonadales bacterium]